LARVKIGLTAFCIFFTSSYLFAEDGYRLWLRYDKIKDPALLAQYKKNIQTITVEGSSPTFDIIRKEINNGLSGLLGNEIKPNIPKGLSSSLWIGTIAHLPGIDNISQLSGQLGKEGYRIFTKTSAGKKTIIITANTDMGLLYGTFHFLRLLQTNQSIENLSITSVPKLKLRMLNHWDNLNRYVERGYAGMSIWNWHTLPGYTDPRYIDYARANASIGINAVSLTNVMPTQPYSPKLILKK